MEKVIDRKQIRKYAKKVASEISEAHYNDQLYWKKPIVLLGVLNGALPFLVDIMREIDTNIPLNIDTVKISSYNGVFTKGKCKMQKMPTGDLSNCTVIIVEDIVDSGETMEFLVKKLRKKYKNIRIKTCSLLKRSNCTFHVDYLGRVIADDWWVVGNGLDDADGTKRNLKDIFKLTQ